MKVKLSNIREQGSQKYAMSKEYITTQTENKATVIGELKEAVKSSRI
jgi:hypothetical protein